MKIKQITFNKITRIDIAVDFETKEIDIKNIIKQYQKGEISIKGRHKISTFETTCNDKREFESMTINKLSSDNSMKYYNKTKEMYAKGDKSYIRHTWKNAGFDTEQDIYRAEITVKGDIYESEYGSQITLEHIDNKDFINKVFRAAYQNYFLMSSTKPGKAKKLLNMFDNLSTTDMKLIRVKSNNISTRMCKYVVNQVVRTVQEKYETGDNDINIIMSFLAIYMRDNHPAYWNTTEHDRKEQKTKIDFFNTKMNEV